MGEDAGRMRGGCGEDAGREMEYCCFSVVFICFFFLPSNNYYLFLNEISFLFVHFLFQGEPCIFLLFITSAFSKM